MPSKWLVIGVYSVLVDIMHESPASGCSDARRIERQFNVIHVFESPFMYPARRAKPDGTRRRRLRRRVRGMAASITTPPGFVLLLRLTPRRSAAAVACQCW